MVLIYFRKIHCCALDEMSYRTVLQFYAHICSSVLTHHYTYSNKGTKEEHLGNIAFNFPSGSVCLTKC